VIKIRVVTKFWEVKVAKHKAEADFEQSNAGSAKNFLN